MVNSAEGNRLVKVVRLLVNRGGVEANSKDTDGRTPLSYAAASGHEAVVRLLLDRADVEADSKDNGSIASYEASKIIRVDSGGPSIAALASFFGLLTHYLSPFDEMIDPRRAELWLPYWDLRERENLAPHLWKKMPKLFETFPFLVVFANPSLGLPRELTLGRVVKLSDSPVDSVKITSCKSEDEEQTLVNTDVSVIPDSETGPSLDSPRTAVVDGSVKGETLVGSTSDAALDCDSATIGAPSHKLDSEDESSSEDEAVSEVEADWTKLGKEHERSVVLGENL